MAKAIRKQVEIEIDGAKYRVVPTFSTLEMIEQKLSPTGFFRRLSEQDIRVHELAWVLYSSLVVQGVTALEYDEIGEIIIAEGLPKHIEQVTTIIAAILDPGPEEPVKPASNGGKKKGPPRKK